MALDYVSAAEDGLCPALNLTGDACVTLIPDDNNNITDVIHALERIRDASNPRLSNWLHGKFGPRGATFVQPLIPALITLGIMLCFCTIAITLLHGWVGTIVGGTPEYWQMLKYQHIFSSDHDDASQLEDCDSVRGSFFAGILDSIV